MSTAKTNSYFEAVSKLMDYGFSPIKCLKEDKSIKNSLTNRKLNSEYSFFEHKNSSKVIMRQLHQDLSGSAWMKSDFFIKELISWVDDLEVDYAIFFYSGEYMQKKDVKDYIAHLKSTYLYNEKILIFELADMRESLETRL